MIERIVFVPVLVPAHAVITSSGRLVQHRKVVMVETRR